jgi:hypothetical protein
MTTDVEDAQRDVANSKQHLQESLRLAGEAGSRLAVAARDKVTPPLIIAVVLGVAVVAGVALLAGRGRSRSRWRAPRQPSLAGTLALAAGTWLARAIALRVALTIAEQFRDSTGEPADALSASS